MGRDVEALQEEIKKEYLKRGLYIVYSLNCDECKKQSIIKVAFTEFFADGLLKAFRERCQDCDKGGGIFFLDEKDLRERLGLKMISIHRMFYDLYVSLTSADPMNPPFDVLKKLKYERKDERD